jgi:uncharacterized 2Fe-2S/4Fe-4S cluster protein (DUF4445 family)
MEKFKVTFYPDKKTVKVAKDTTIFSAALSCGISINSACGGDGVCGKCKVRVIKGEVFAQPSGAISPEEKKKNIYLACITAVHSDLEVDILEQSRLDSDKESLQEQDVPKGFYAKPEEIETGSLACTEGVFERSTLTRKLFLKIPPPDFQDRLSDLERLYRQIGAGERINTKLHNIRQLGRLLRDAQWEVSATLHKSGDSPLEIILLEPGDTSTNNFGFAFDIGTTTVSGQLINLNTGKVLGTKVAVNRQTIFGSDVITRIVYAQQKGGLEKLHNLVTESINQIIRELAEEYGVDLNDATCVICAGNTTMTHLLLNIDPSHIRREPYVPVANFIPVLRAAEAGVNINQHGLLYCVPGVASYVGGDITSGVLSCGLYKEEDLCILIDIGTNGEIVVGNKDFLVACAASAGPAFEGSGVACGMRSSRGAIQKVRIEPEGFEVNYETIGGVKPRGICGSGYIDLIRGMLKTGIMDKGGKIQFSGHRRIRRGRAGNEFIVAFKKESDSSGDIVITEADLENLKRAKAAIYSATAMLIRHLGLDFSQAKKVFIAGGFGTNLDIDSAVEIGLLPDIERSKFIFVGNSSLSGARSMLLSAEAVKKAEEIARKITYFELSLEPGYMDEYMAALFFPHTDLNLFPSVKK